MSNPTQFGLESAPALAKLAAETAAKQEPCDGGIPTRPLGSTGERVSIVCLGGWHVADADTEDESIKIMHAAIDAGINFFDNAWDYHDGMAEERMGKGLSTGGRRDKVFLMTKNCARDAKGTRQHCEDSLRRLQTDRLDLWQFHEINYDNDPEWIFTSGAFEEALKLQEEGKVRFIGFTGHKDPRIHLDMLARHKWDTVQMPINVCDAFYRSFVHTVIPEVDKIGAGSIGMKSLGGGKRDPGAQFIAEGVCDAVEARRFALSMPISSLVCGIDTMEVLEQDLKVARDFEPMTEAEMTELMKKVQGVAPDGRHELFKSGQHFDGPYHREQHGFALDPA